MKKIFTVLMFIFFAQLSASQINEKRTDIQQTRSTEPKVAEIVLSLPFEHLVINSNGIFVNYDGQLLAVHSLTHTGDLWLARAHLWEDHAGHTRACPCCGGCAVPGCPWYCDGYCCGRQH